MKNALVIMLMMLGLLSVASIALSQESTMEVVIEDLENMSALDHYLNTNRLNEVEGLGSLDVRSNKRFKLDSAITYDIETNVPLNKGLFLLEDFQEIFLSYEDEDNVWKPDYVVAHDYNDMGLRSRQRSFLWWDGSMDYWETELPNIDRTYDYDEDGKLKTFTSYQHVSADEKKIIAYRDYVYDEDGLLDVVNYYVTSSLGDTLYRSGSYNYIHNSLSQLVAINDYDLTESQELSTVDSTALVYNGELLYTETRYFGDGAGKFSLTPTYQTEYSYYPDGILKVRIERRGYQETTGNWYNVDFYTYLYGDDGSFKCMILGDINTTPIAFRRCVLRDTSISREEILLPRISTYTSDEIQPQYSMIKELFEISEDFFGQSEGFSSIYHYSPLDPLSVDDPSTDIEGLTRVIPNPFTTSVQFHSVQQNGFGKLLIHDLAGRLICEQQMKYHEEVDLSFLQAGVYFYQIVHQGKSIGGKLVKL